MELKKQDRQSAIHSLKQYADRNLPEPLGDLGAGLLLDFFLEEIGPLVFNHAVGEAQARLQRSVSELDGELYAEPFTYWSKTGKRSR